LTDHQEFQVELAAYAASRLEGEPARRLEAHLRECEECREMASLLKEFGRTLKEGGETLFEAHPSPDMLRDFSRGAAGRGRGAPGQGTQVIVRHLESCASCGLEVEALRSAAVVPRKISIGRMAGPLAAGVVLGIGLATFARMVLPPLRETGRGAPTPTATAGPMLVLPRLVRGSEEKVTYAVDRGSGYVVVACPAAVPEDASPEQGFVYVMKEPAGNTVWSQAMSARSIREHLAGAAASVILLVPATGLHPGRYEFALGREGSSEQPIYRVDVEMTGAR
jgi:hypothetical protein